MSNVDHVQSLYAAFGRGDLEAIISGLTPDVAWEDYGRATDFPTLGPRSGHAEVRGFFEVLASELDFRQFEPREVHAVAEKVFVQGHSQILVRKTGRVIDTDWVHIFTLRDGKVAGFREFADTAQMAEAYRVAA